MAMARALQRICGSGLSSTTLRVLSSASPCTQNLQQRGSTARAIQEQQPFAFRPNRAVQPRHIVPLHASAAGRSLTTFTSSRGGSLSASTQATETKAEAPEEPTEGTKFVSEFTVQTLFNFLSCTAVATAQNMSGGNGLHAAFMVMGAHAVILPMLIYVFMPISGAHFNPMVTMSMVAAGRQTPRSGASYVVAQLLGAVLGSYIAINCLPTSLQNAAMAGAQAVPAGHTIAQAFLGEVMASFFFVSVLFGCLVDPRGWGKLGPLAVPLAILLLMWLVGPISSMCINPARAFGPAFVTGVWDNHWIWWTAPFVGGPAAAVLYSKLFLPISARPKIFR